MAELNQLTPARAAAPANPVYRRNGLLQSCEPCRKRKLGCDHAVPCGRCVRRQLGHQCFYGATGEEPAGTQRRREPAAVRPQPKTSNQVQGSQLVGEAVPVAPVRRVSEPTLLPGYTQLDPSLSWPGGTGTVSLDTSAIPNQVGFLGSSSYSAVVDEINGSLAIPETGSILDPSIYTSPVPEELVRKGADVLFQLRDLQMLDRLLQRWLAIGDGYLIFGPIYRTWMQEITNQLGAILSGISSPEDLHNMSTVVWRNTRMPIEVDGTTTARAWAQRSTGQYLRWETIGLLFSAIGIVSGSLSSRDAVFVSQQGSVKDRPTLVRNMLDLVNSCIEFCKICVSQNDLYACLLYESLLLLERSRGKVSSDSWLRMGEISATMVILGLHQEKKVDERVPVFLCELRTRLFEQVYSHDKVLQIGSFQLFLATYLGRPPHISHRYCVRQTSLELSDEEVCAEGADLAMALSSLEPGKKVPKRPHRTSWRGAWSEHALIRELILEIAIGPSTSDVDVRVSELHARIAQANEATPAYVKTDPEQLLDDIQHSVVRRIPGYDAEWQPIDVMYLIAVHCGMRHTEFLLERAVVLRKQLDSRRLVPTARNLLRLVLRIAMMKDYCSDFQVDLIGLLAFYAIPSAGVLSLELLKQEQSLVPAFDPIPRSETIQQLSILIPALAAVGPAEGNHAICAQGRVALQRVLDRILEPPPPKQPSTSSSLDEGLDMAWFDSMPPLIAAQNDAEFMEWLSSDWLEKM